MTAGNGTASGFGNSAAERDVIRAIAARERRKAKIEREAAMRPPPVIPPSTVGWSKRPGRAKKSGAADQAIADRARARHDAHARRHPQAAADERALRKGRAEALARWDHKREGTAETHEDVANRREGPLARLWLAGSIDADQLVAAVEIATVSERIGADVAVATASLETRIDRSRWGDGKFFEGLSAVRHEMAYTRWRRALGGTAAPVLEMIVGDAVGFTVVAKRYRMHNRRAKAMLIAALDLWPRMLGDVCKEVDAGVLAAAQAGLLA